MSLSCLNCSKPLIKWQKKYCSFSCQAKNRKTTNLKEYNEHRRKKPKKCQNVSCETLTTNPKYCSHICSCKAKTNTKKIIKCIGCNKNTSNKSYCSQKCRITTKKTKEQRKINTFNVQTYRARKKNQTPPWADLDKIKEIYLNCPKGYEVDHIHPMSKGGLHVDYNLQYLTSLENKIKNNKI